MDIFLDAETRSAKMFSKKTYETGVVIVRCPGCQGNHLIADRLGWFGEPGSIEDYLRQRGEGDCTLDAYSCAPCAAPLVLDDTCYVCWLNCTCVDEQQQHEFLAVLCNS